LELPAKVCAPQGLRGARIWPLCQSLRVQLVGLATAGGGAPEATGRAVSGAGAIVFALLFGGGFVCIGVQSIRGTASDTLGNGIGSILLGLLCLSCGGSDLVSVASGVGGRPVAVGVISAAVNLLSGVGLLAAGVLALVGRSEYVAWKRRSKR
jgi:hypothetical protein